MNEKFEHLIERAEQLIARIESVLPQPLAAPDWSSAIAWRYRKRSSGHGALEPVRHVAAMRLADLQEIDGQKEKIQRNTEQFVRGLPANNVLLTGARGTGKSSLIKACLNAYAPLGLRLIEVDKADLTDLPDIVEVVAGRPEYFIVFCDDLSFEDGEPGYKALKSILDGSVAAATPNVLIYATSNRRHLLPEYMRENLTYTHTDDGEVHPGEGVEEKISLSERFGPRLLDAGRSDAKGLEPLRHDRQILVLAEGIEAHPEAKTLGQGDLFLHHLARVHFAIVRMGVREVFLHVFRQQVPPVAGGIDQHIR